MDRPAVNPDPHLQAAANFVVDTVAKVERGELKDTDALAALAADCLGLSLQLHVHPDAADELLGMAQSFAAQRYAAINAPAVMAETPIPDDASGLEEE